MQRCERINNLDAEVQYQVSPPLSGDELNGLFAVSWTGHVRRNFQPVLNRSPVFISAHCAGRLIGFVNLAWDGGYHAFILDTTVHPEFRLRGVGRELVSRALAEAKGRGVEWVHVDFGTDLEGFYESCGFLPTAAGLIRLPLSDIDCGERVTDGNRNPGD